MKNSPHLNRIIVKFAWNIAFYAGIGMSVGRKFKQNVKVTMRETVTMLKDKELKNEMFRNFFKRTVIKNTDSTVRQARVTKILPDGNMFMVFFTIEGTPQKGSMLMSKYFVPNIGDLITYNSEDSTGEIKDAR